MARKHRSMKSWTGPTSIDTSVLVAANRERRTYVTESRRRGESSELGDSSGDTGNSTRSNEMLIGLGKASTTLCKGVRGVSFRSSSGIVSDRMRMTEGM